MERVTERSRLVIRRQGRHRIQPCQRSVPDSEGASARQRGIQGTCSNHTIVQSHMANTAQYHFKNKDVVTVWSAPNYCYRCGNVASIMQLEEDLTPRFTIFQAVPDDQRMVPQGRTGRSEYFL